MTMLLIALAAFVGTHLLLSHPLRAPLVGVIGARGFLLVYSLVAAGTLGCAIAGTLMVLVFPAVTKSIVDQVVLQHREERLLRSEERR